MTGSGKIHARKCDLLVDSQIVQEFEYIEQHFEGVDVLVSNAGFFKANTVIGKCMFPFHEELNGIMSRRNSN